VIINPYIFGGGVVVPSYNSVVATAAPKLWWRLDETGSVGTTAADSASPVFRDGAYVAAPSLSTIAVPPGYAGLGSGYQYNSSNQRVSAYVNTSGANDGTPAVLFGGSASSAWSIAIWVTGAASASKYLASRINEAAIIYQFVTDKVEFFSIGYTGTNPRTGSQISLAGSDTTTPHWIVYVYNNGVWQGYLDGVQVFNLSASFALPMTGNLMYLSTDGSGSRAFSSLYDFQVYDKALTSTQITAIWAARNNP
jgi:hypothetical protein